MRNILILFITFELVVNGFVNGYCLRPAGILLVEEQCYETSYGVLEKAHRAVTDLMNRASKRLGIQSGAEAVAQAANEPKKCAFYQCIFKKLMLTNQYELPDINLINTMFNNTGGFDKTQYAQLEHCANTLEDKLDPPTLNERVLESAICDVSLELMKCLHIPADDCPLFQFP